MYLLYLRVTDVVIYDDFDTFLFSIILHPAGLTLLSIVHGKHMYYLTAQIINIHIYRREQYRIIQSNTTKYIVAACSMFLNGTSVAS
jgi:hypothetical protein